MLLLFGFFYLVIQTGVEGKYQFSIAQICLLSYLPVVAHFLLLEGAVCREMRGKRKCLLV